MVWGVPFVCDTTPWFPKRRNPQATFRAHPPESKVVSMSSFEGGLAYLQMCQHLLTADIVHPSVLIVIVPATAVVRR